jgi:soluble lytic murein transglycosylase
LIALAAAACARKDAPASPSAQGSAAALGDAVSVDEDAGPPLPWAEAVRLERWDEAEKTFESLPSENKARADVRYARARVALARGDAKTAASLLDKLEGELPLLADLIARHRAEAQLKVGPFDAAGEYYGAKPAPSAQLKAAEAFEKAGNAARARAACDRVIGADKRSRAQEAQARAIRMRVAKDDASAVADARWIATRAPDLPFAREADALLARLDPSHPLNGEELLQRAQALADAQRAEDALVAIAQAAAATAKRPFPVEISRARAEAFFKSKRYPEAHLAYAQAAQLGSTRAADDAFQSARCLARADRDDEAILGYRDVAQRYPRTTWADQASFQVGRLQLLLGRWREAAEALDEYAKRFPSGSERRDAERFRAIAHLMAKDNATARRLFEQIADDAQEPHGAARATNLAALAAYREGDRTHAVARWMEVARGRPLTWPALVARARLAEAGAQLPPHIDPPATTGEMPGPLVVRLPPPADMLHRMGFDDEAEDVLQDRERVVRAAAPGREVEALCTAYGALGRGERRYKIAQQVPGPLLASAPTARTRWAWDCVFPQPFESHVRQHEKSDDLPEGLVYAVMRQESAFDPDVVSPARAVGLMQLLPETAKVVATGASLPTEEALLTSPPHNIALGSLYLHEMLGKFQGSAALAAAAYNAGPEAVARWISRSRGMDLDVFVERIPYAETRGYVVRVMGNLARYGYLRKGDAGVPQLKLALD